VTDDAVHLARDRIADRIAADRIRRLIDEFDAMCDQPFEGPFVLRTPRRRLATNRNSGLTDIPD
jgi:hypothetical protein